MRARVIAAVAVIVVLGLALSGLAAGGGATGAKSVKLTAKPAGAEQIDLGASGPSAGEMLVGRADLYQGGRKVGFARFTCVFNIGTGVMCTNHNTLFGRGQIVSQQSGDPSRGPVVIEAVTGGTGEFRNARGQARVDFTNPEAVRITIRLIG